MRYWIFCVWICVFALSAASIDPKKLNDLYWIRITLRDIVRGNLTKYPFFKALRPFTYPRCTTPAPISCPQCTTPTPFSCPECTTKCPEYPTATVGTLSTLFSLSMIVNAALFIIFYAKDKIRQLCSV